MSSRVQSLLQIYQQQAQSKLPPEVWHYLESDAGSGSQNLQNTSGWQQYRIYPRPLHALQQPHTTCEFFGERWAHPVVLAPVAYQKLFHSEGEVGSAVACNAQGGQMLVSSLASQTLSEIAQQAQQALWFQLYWQGDRARTLALVNKALSTGYRVIVFTVDAPVKQALIDLPKGIAAVNLDQPLRPKKLQSGQSQVFDGWMTHAPDWDDLAWMRQQISAPLMIKGLMHVADCQRVVEMGCDGMIVSNHGGRVLDSTPTVVDVLPEIVSVVGGRIKVMVDSGFRNGQDIFKAIALGADAVCVGRPYIYGLVSEGAMGVARIIRTLRDELEMTMALAGVSNLQEIRQTQLFKSERK